MLRAGRKVALPLTYVPATNIQRIIRNYSVHTNEQDLKVPVTIPTAEHDEHQYEENVKTRILESALEFVPKTGWSIESLSAGAKAAGYPTITHGLFPNGGGDLVHYFNIKCNDQLVQLMKTVSTYNTVIFSIESSIHNKISVSVPVAKRSIKR